MTIENQRTNVSVACERLAVVANDCELVVSHGNGPQIGLLALEAVAYVDVPAYPLDVLGAETEGMIGYLIEQELGNRLPQERHVVTVLTMVEVNSDDPAFLRPSKPIGPLYDATEAETLARQRGWSFRPDGEHQRRVVASPVPLRIIEEKAIRLLLESGCVVICAGGGGIPTAYDSSGDLIGVEAVIDKDHASSLLARDLDADVFVMATDTPFAYTGFNTSEQRAILEAHPAAILATYRDEFAGGSMLPKVEAACAFANATGRTAVIGQLTDIEGLVSATAGTRISTEFDGITTD